MDVWEGQTWEEKIGKWVWGGDERNTLRVWVAGKEVWRAKEEMLSG
jgi:guanine deaminase